MQDHIERTLTIPSNFNVTLKVMVDSAWMQRIHVSVDGHSLGTWEGIDKKDLVLTPVFHPNVQTTFLVRIEHLTPGSDWRPSDHRERVEHVGGTTVWSVVTEDGGDDDWNDAVVAVFMSMPFHRGVEERFDMKQWHLELKRAVVGPPVG